MQQSHGHAILVPDLQVQGHAVSLPVLVPLVGLLPVLVRPAAAGTAFPLK